MDSLILAIAPGTCCAIQSRV